MYVDKQVFLVWFIDFAGCFPITRSVQQIPVYKGFSKPLLARKQHASDYHGKDGLGDVPDPDAPSVELLQKEKAAEAMLKIARENPGEVGK